jgi:DNA-binding NarL/FixJ family response regulator
VPPPQPVLVVDDEPYYRDTIRDALSLDGIECDLAAGPTELLKAIEDPRVACVVLDVRLTAPASFAQRAGGERSPSDLMALLEAMLEQRPALRVIALATQDDQELVLTALHAGACDYLAKPIHDEELCLAVRRALRGHTVEAGLAALRAHLWRLVEHGDPSPPEAPGAALESEDELLVRALAERIAAAASEPEPVPEPAAAAGPAPAESAERGDREGEVELLRAIADGMTREIEPARLLAASLRPIARATAARAASIHLIDNATGRLVCEAQVEGTDVDRSDLPRGAGLTGGSLQSGAIVATDRPERDARFDPAVDTPESGAIGPLLVIPLRVRDRVLGVARVFPGESVGASARLAELVAAPLSAATRNVLLYRSLLDSVEDVARARREAEGRR